MGYKRVCVAVLVLQMWGAVSARPSDGAQAGGTRDLSANLLDRNTIFNACPRPPDVLSTPSEVAGDWCGLENLEVTERGPPATCNRVKFIAEEGHIRVIINSLDNGQIVHTRNVTLSRIANDSWLTIFNNRTTNLFIGMSGDGKYLRMCGTTVVGEGTPTEVNNVVLGRCLGPGEEELVATGQRPNVERCNLP